MKSFLTTCLIFLSGFALPAANFYVRPSSAGSNNGSNWQNCWSFSSINWSGVHAGDTVWLAGGTYSSGLDVSTGGGSAAGYVSVKRVLATDAIPVGVAGWDPSFDSTVNITPASGSTISVEADYVAIDGRVFGGIYCTLPSQASIGGVNIHASHTDFRNISVVGNNPSVAIPTDATAPYGIGYGSCSYSYASNCMWSGTVNMLTLSAASAITNDHCIWTNCASLNTYYHPDVVEDIGSTGLVIENCDVSKWAVAGIYLYNGCGTATITGCVFHDPLPTQGAPDVLWVTSQGQTTGGPVYFYNNTCVNCIVYGNRAYTVVPAAGSQSRNNIYWNSSVSGSWITDDDYDFSDGTQSTATHSIQNGNYPFSGVGWNIVATVGAKYPKDKGVTLASPYNIDPNGNTRGADGAFDIGAYEVQGADLSTNTVLLSPVNFGSGSNTLTYSSSFQIKNTGLSNLVYSASIGAPFSLGTNGSGTIAPGATNTVQVFLNSSAYGNYTNTGTVSGGGGATFIAEGTTTNGPTTVPTWIYGSGAFALSGSSLSFPLTNPAADYKTMDIIGVGHYSATPRTITSVTIGSGPSNAILITNVAYYTNGLQSAYVLTNPPVGVVTATVNFSGAITEAGVVWGSFTNATTIGNVFAQYNASASGFSYVMPSTNNSLAVNLALFGGSSGSTVLIPGAPQTAVGGFPQSNGKQTEGMAIQSAVSNTVTCGWTFPTPPAEPSDQITFNLGNAVTVPASPTNQVSPTTSDFGTFILGLAVTNSVVWSNTGNGTLTINASANYPWTILSGATASLTHGQSVTTVLRFAPTTTGVYADALQNSDGTAVALTGTVTNYIYNYVPPPPFLYTTYQTNGAPATTLFQSTQTILTTAILQWPDMHAQSYLIGHFPFHLPSIGPTNFLEVPTNYLVLASNVDENVTPIFPTNEAYYVNGLTAPLLLGPDNLFDNVISLAHAPNLQSAFSNMVTITNWTDTNAPMSASQGFFKTIYSRKGRLGI